MSLFESLYSEEEIERLGHEKEERIKWLLQPTGNFELDDLSYREAERLQLISDLDYAIEDFRNNFDPLW